jgi:uncharacterized sulfatase
MLRILLALLGLSLTGSVLAQETARPPNIVFLIADDQGWGDYSFMGHPHIRTPNLDKLAAESLVFTRGYVPSSLCRASLASLVTGLYPHQHKITSNDPPLPKGLKGGAANKDPRFLAQRQEMIAHIDKVPTLPRLLAEKGYLSHQSGKWWEGHFSRGGFTHGMTHGDPAKNGRHGDVGLKIGREGLGEVFGFLDSAVAQKKPFFLWYAPMMPHTPHTPPERLLAKYQVKTPSLHIARYWAMCEWFDETCGQLLDQLAKKGLADNTLVLYVCDNGWIQDPNAGQQAPRSKRSPYDGGIRTPILVRWPGKVKPGKSLEFALSIDLVPTALASVGIKQTAAMQGINLLDTAATTKRQAVTGAIFEHNAVELHQPASSLQYRWVIEGDWKLIVPAPRTVPTGKVELFNVARDPLEAEELASKHPDKVANLTKLLDTWWRPE